MDASEKTSRELLDEVRKAELALVELQRENELLRLTLDQLPCLLELYDLDGTTTMINDAMLKALGIPAAEMVVGAYNVLEDPAIEALGVLGVVKCAYAGETALAPDLRVPLEQLLDVYGDTTEDSSLKYVDAIVFPVKDRDGNVLQIGTLLQPRAAFVVRDSVKDAIEYLKEHYREDYKLEDVACAANLSPSHFARLFKAEVGKTPYSFFVDLKIDGIKECLADPDPSIRQCFLMCGLSYNGHYAKVFKSRVGMTPSEYRASIRKPQ